MNVDFFSRQGFLDRVFRVSYTCRSDYSVYAGRCTYTHLTHAHFSAHSACTITFAHFHACHTHAWLKGAKKVRCTCVTSLHLAFSRLMSHPSLLFFDGHFETTPDFDVHTFLPYLPVLQAQGMRKSARGQAVWLSGHVRPQHSWRQKVRFGSPSEVVQRTHVQLSEWQELGQLWRSA